MRATSSSSVNLPISTADRMNRRQEDETRKWKQIHKEMKNFYKNNRDLKR